MVRQPTVEGSYIVQPLPATWRQEKKQFFVSAPGLPDGVFSHQKSKFGYIFGRLGMENVGIFNGHLKHFTASW
jgi:hypothetical protein